MRTKAEIVEAEQEALERLWYARHTTPRPGPPDEFWLQGEEHADELRRRYPDLVTGDAIFFAGHDLLAGRLEALRWVLGDDWGNLDT